MIQSKIEDLIRPSIESLGYELWGCEYLSQGRHSLLRVYIDKAEGIGITDCEQVSHQVGALLDVDDPISGNYSLEVSSPGIPRPLLHIEQYQRYLGHEVHLKLVRPIAGSRKWAGQLIAANAQEIVLSVAKEQQVSIAMSAILKAHVI